MKIKRWVGEMVITVMWFVLTSCASTTQGVLSSQSQYIEVFRACIQAANEADFGVTSSDSNAGLIFAEQNTTMGVKVVRMNITVKKVNSGTQVEVGIVPPPGTTGSTKAIFDQFTVALTSKVADVKVISVSGK